MNEYMASDMASEKRRKYIRDFHDWYNKDPRNTFFGGLVIGGALGFAVGILAVAVYVHLMFL